MTGTLRPSRVAAAAIGVVLAAGSVVRAEGSFEKGRDLFASLCTPCHSLGEAADVNGPDLKDVTLRRSRDWLRRYLLDPEGMLAGKDPIAVELLNAYRGVPMPSLGLTAAQVEDLIAFLDAAARSSPAELAALGPLPGTAAAGGRQLFQSACASCHTIGGGDGVGPDLKGVVSKRDRSWLKRWLLEPDRMLREKDPIASELLARFKNVPMPNLGLTDPQAESLLAFLSTEAAGPTAVASEAPPAGLPPGDAVRGKALFTGQRRFRNGGPPCMGCHGIAGIGALGGGALGPDLTLTVKKFGRQGMPAVLASLPFPTMQPVFAGRPLTVEEQADLLAFLEGPTVTREPGALRRLAWLALVGAGVLFAGAGLAWRRKLGPTRRALVRRAA